MTTRYYRLLVMITAFLILFSGTLICFHAYLPGLISLVIEKELNSRSGNSAGEHTEYKVGDIEAGIFFKTISISEFYFFRSPTAGNEILKCRSARKDIEIGIYNAEVTVNPFLLLMSGKNNIAVSKFQADSISVNVHNFHSLPNSGGVSRKIANMVSYGNEFGVFQKTSGAHGFGNPADTGRLQIHSGHIRFEGKIEFPRTMNDIFENIVLKEHSVQVSNASFSLPGNLYRIYTDSISFAGEEGTISISGLQMIPRHSKEEFYKHVTYETDRIGVVVDSIEITGFRPLRVKDRNVFVFSQIDVKGGTLDVFRDRRPPFDEQQRPDMPVRLIRTAPFGLHAATINLSEIDILYSEFPGYLVSPDFSESTGEIPFKKLAATIRNISNLADSLARDSIMRIDARAVIFDEAVLTAEFSYNLKDLDGSYSAAGELNELPFPAINQALYPLARIKAAEGIHKGSVFSFSGNDVESEGELFMEWSDLLIELLPDEGEIVNAITQAAGELLYHSSTPGNEDSPSGKIEFERDISRFVFHYWWNSYLSGIKNSVLRDFVPL